MAERRAERQPSPEPEAQTTSEYTRAQDAFYAAIYGDTEHNEPVMFISALNAVEDEGLKETELDGPTLYTNLARLAERGARARQAKLDAEGINVMQRLRDRYVTVLQKFGHLLPQRDFESYKMTSAKLAD